MSIRSMKSVPALTAAAAILALYALSASAAPQVNELAGIWEITGVPVEVTEDPDGSCELPGSFVNTVKVSSDGSILNVDPFLGAGVGEVHRLRGKTFALGIFGYLPTPPPVVLGYEIQATGTVTGPDTVVGEFRTILGTGCVYTGTIEGTRLYAQPF